jgi:hypothetical protein
MLHREVKKFGMMEGRANRTGAKNEPVYPVRYVAGFISYRGHAVIVCKA